MSKLHPFQEILECPKCGDEEIDVRYRSSQADKDLGAPKTVRLVDGEHLEISCLNCSHRFPMMCRDAAPAA